MGTVRRDLVHFCPLDDEVTLEAIASQIEMHIKLEGMFPKDFNSDVEGW